MKSYSDNNVLIKFVNQHIILTNIVVFIVFGFFVFISHWSLLIGENLMKWDIWDAEYPAQVLMSDALDNGTIPLWNPLFRYGAPFYSVLGTPVWYPFTLLLAWIGYTPFTVSYSYVMHIIFGGYGAFQFAKEHIKNANNEISVEGFCACIIAGMLYCGCGVFLSNAQHIMVAISAAWIPYVFFFARKYLMDKKLIYAMLTGGVAGLILTGGYPEMFYNLFLLLIPYFLYMNYNKEYGKAKNILLASFKYLIVCVMTIFSAAVIILPFINNMGLITRGNGLGQVPLENSFAILFSILFPAMTRFVTVSETSMVNFYMGLITVFLLPLIFTKKRKDNFLYLFLVICAFSLCWGTNSPLHSLLYRFLPMYSNFRFPTLNRIFIMLFVIVLVAVEIRDLFESRAADYKYHRILQGAKILLVSIFVMSVLSSIIYNLGNVEENLSLQKCMYFSEAAFISCIFILGYLLLFSLAKNKQFSKNMTIILLVVLVGIEVITYTYYETPITIASYPPTAYSNTPGVKEKIEKEMKAYNKRNKTVEFAGSKRSTNGLKSKKIVFDKTFDEEGYMSFLLNSVVEFKETYLRSIMEQNPVVYFTNDIVDSKQVKYPDWSNRCDTPPEQIYVESNKAGKNDIVQRFVADIISEQELPFYIEDNHLIIEGDLSSEKNTTGRLRVYIGDNQEEFIALNVVYVLGDGQEKVYQGNYQIYNDGEDYIELYYPDIEEKYIRIELSGGLADVHSVKQVVVDRMTKDAYVDVTSFRFNDIEMNVDAIADGYVTLLQAKHDGWHAYVDGIEVDIETVNGCFMGVFLEEGDHTVILKFRPMEFFIGAGITIIYWVVLFTMVLYSLVYSKKFHQRKIIIQ